MYIVYIIWKYSVVFFVCFFSGVLQRSKLKTTANISPPGASSPLGNTATANI